MFDLHLGHFVLFLQLQLLLEYLNLNNKKLLQLYLVKVLVHNQKLYNLLLHLHLLYQLILLHHLPLLLNNLKLLNIVSVPMFPVSLPETALSTATIR